MIKTSMKNLLKDNLFAIGTLFIEQFISEICYDHLRKFEVNKITYLISNILANFCTNSLSKRRHLYF
jgi:hypothetical protein